MNSMQETFGEAGADLARTLACGAAAPAGPAAGEEPVESIIRRLGGGT